MLVGEGAFYAASDFAGVAAAEGFAVLFGPGGEGGGACGGGVGVEQAAHESGDLFACDDDVADDGGEGVGDGEAEPGRDGDDGAADAEDACERADEVGVCEGLGADGVGGGGVVAVGVEQHEFGHVVDVEWAEAVVALAEDADDGEVADGPCDVVDEDVAASEEDAGADDGVGRAECAEGVFEFVLAAVVGEVVGLVGVED